MELKNMPAKPEWLRASVKSQVGKIDREKGIIHGVILAEEGPFKDLRGEFDRKAIRATTKLANERSGGLKSRLSHPSLSSDGIGKFLGRTHDHRTDTVLREVGKDVDGQPLMKEMLVTRGDLHLDKTALDEPVGGGKPLGIYVMDLAESDPEALGLSLVLQVDQEYRLDKQGRRLKGDDGEDLPPLWTPKALHAVDVVDDGDATHSFLSADILAGLPDAIVRQGCELLDQQFPGQGRDVIRARLAAFVDRYLAHRFGDELGEEADRNEALAVEPAAEQEGAPEPAKSDDALLLELYLVDQE